MDELEGGNPCTGSRREDGVLESKAVVVFCIVHSYFVCIWQVVASDGESCRTSVSGLPSGVQISDFPVPRGGSAECVRIRLKHAHTGTRMPSLRSPRQHVLPKQQPTSSHISSPPIVYATAAVPRAREGRDNTSISRYDPSRAAVATDNSAQF